MATGKPVHALERSITSLLNSSLLFFSFPLFSLSHLSFVSLFSFRAPLLLYVCMCVCIYIRYLRTRNLLAEVINRNDIKKEGGEGEKREKLISFYWELDHSSPCIVLWMQIGCNFIKGTLLRITYDRASIGPQPLPLPPHLPSPSSSILFTLGKRCIAPLVIQLFAILAAPMLRIIMSSGDWYTGASGLERWLAGLDRVVELSMVIDRGERSCRFFINFQPIRVIIYLIFV